MKGEGEGKRTCTGGNGNADVGVDQDLAPGGDRRVLGGVDVVAGGEGAAPRGHLGLVRELLDLERRGGRGAADTGIGAGIVVRLDALAGRRRGCLVGGRHGFFFLSSFLSFFWWMGTEPMGREMKVFGDGEKYEKYKEGKGEEKKKGK